MLCSVFFSRQFACQGHPWTVAVIYKRKTWMRDYMVCWNQWCHPAQKDSRVIFPNISSFHGWMFLSMFTKNAFQKPFQWHPTLEIDAPHWRFAPPLCNLLYRFMVFITFVVERSCKTILKRISLPLSALSKDLILLGAPDITSPFAQGRFFTTPRHWAILKWSHHPRWMRKTSWMTWMSPMWWLDDH